MRIVVFGANGATGHLVVTDALVRGHHVVAVTRRPEHFPIKDPRIDIVRADVTSGDGLAAAVSGCDAVASALGAAGYSRKPITVYSAGTKAIVSAMREARCKRLVVVSSGLTYPPPRGQSFFVDHVIVPILHDRIGRTLYADMRAMEEFLRTQPDIDWTVIRPGRLINGNVGLPYVKVPETRAWARNHAQGPGQSHSRRDRKRRRCSCRNGSYQRFKEVLLMAAEGLQRCGVY